MDHDHRHHHASQTGPLVVRIRYPASPETCDFTRADVLLTGVDHSGVSYEVRLFLNNPGADGDTPRDDASGYAGRFHVFGHGGCFGDVGHCDVPPPSADPTDLRPPHQLTAMTTYVTVTRALGRLLLSGAALETISLVPLSLPPQRDRGRPAYDLFRYETVDLRTYVTPLDEPAI